MLIRPVLGQLEPRRLGQDRVGRRVVRPALPTVGVAVPSGRLASQGERAKGDGQGECSEPVRGGCPLGMQPGPSSGLPRVRSCFSYC